MQKNHLLNFVKTNATLIALIVLTVALALADDSFFTARNLSNLARQVTIVGIIAVGMTTVILIAGSGPTGRSSTCSPCDKIFSGIERLTCTAKSVGERRQRSS